MMARNSQYSGGSGTNPTVFASGETVSHASAATMITEVRMSGQLPAFGVVFGQNFDDLPFDFHHHRHAPTHEVERNLVYLAVLLVRFQVLSQLLMVENRFVEQVLQPGMVVAVQVAILQHLLAGIALHVQMLFEHDLALG